MVEMVKCQCAPAVLKPARYMIASLRVSSSTTHRALPAAPGERQRGACVKANAHILRKDRLVQHYNPARVQRYVD